MLFAHLRRILKLVLGGRRQLRRAQLSLHRLINISRTATENAFPAIPRSNGFAKNVEILIAVDAVISG